MLNKEGNKRGSFKKPVLSYKAPLFYPHTNFQISVKIDNASNWCGDEFVKKLPTFVFY